MTYQNFITLVNREVLDRRAWPNDSSKLQEQIDLAYVAGLAVATDIPLARLVLVTSSLTATNVPSSTTKTYAFPANVFDSRHDLGVHSIVIDGKDRFVNEAMPVNSVYRAGENPLQAGGKHFSVDIDGRKVYANNASSVSIRHFPRPVKPTTSNYNSTDYFIPTTDIQRAVHVVASHISGVRIRDNAGATFHSLLEQFYSKN